jgi:cytoplasmic iron level regulating protein YaaA (DUF328/UPF0246 family)
VLIVLPPSETKRPPPDDGPPVDLASLSFPSLTPMRRRILAALVATRAEPDAFRRLHVGHSLADEVIRNTWLPAQPTRPALEVYSGPLYQALAASTLSERARRRAETQLVVVSSLWGAVRPTDRIPAYRLHVCSRLIGLDRLEPTWRTVLPAALRAAAGPNGAIVELRSPSYQAVGVPDGLEDRTVVVRVVRDDDGSGRVPNDPAKRTRGELTRHLLEADADPSDPEAVCAILSERWSTGLTPPARSGQAWTATVAIPV